MKALPLNIPITFLSFRIGTLVIPFSSIIDAIAVTREFLVAYKSLENGTQISIAVFCSSKRLISSFKNSMVSNMEEFSFSQNNPAIFDVFKSQEFKDIKILTKSFYFFLNVTIQDILAGKKLFKKFDDMIDIAVNNLLVNNIDYYFSCCIFHLFNY